MSERDPSGEERRDEPVPPWSFAPRPTPPADARGQTPTEQIPAFSPLAAPPAPPDPAATPTAERPRGFPPPSSPLPAAPRPWAPPATAPNGSDGWARPAASAPAPPLYDPTTGPGWASPPAGWAPAPLPAEAPTKRRRVGLAAAAVGGLIGALVASLVAVGLLAVGDDDDGPREGTVIAADGEALDIQELLESAQPSVATIETGESQSLFSGAGSGVVISDDGLVLTNSHVVQGASSIQVVFFDGTSAEATLVGSFPDDDIALVQAEGVSDLTPATLGVSEDLRVGDQVVAIGNALNLGGTPSVTLGIVSAKDRSIEAPGIFLDNLIQTDAAINPGNSGGPLVNSSGEVVGINTAIIEDAQNIGFSIAIDALKPLIEELRDGQGAITPDTPFLGVSSVDVDSETLTDTELEELGVETEEGALVVDVRPGSAAEEAGLEPGDVLTAMNGEEVTSSEEVGDVVRNLEPGDEVDITYERQGDEQQTTATLGALGD